MLKAIGMQKIKANQIRIIHIHYLLGFHQHSTSGIHSECIENNLCCIRLYLVSHFFLSQIYVQNFFAIFPLSDVVGERQTTNTEIIRLASFPS